MNNETAMAFSAIMIVLLVYLAILALAVTDYILSSLALQKIGSRRKVNNPWLVWLPFVHNWSVGALADEYDSHKGIKRKWRVILLVLSCCSSAAIILMYFVMFSQMLSLGLQYGDTTTPPDSAILSVLLSFYLYLIIFAVFQSVFNALYNICFFKIFESIAPQKAVLYFILSLLVPLARGICLFKLRNSGYHIEYRYPEPQPTALAEASESADTIQE